MRLTLILYISIIYLFCSCKAQNNSKPKPAFKDSVLKQYIGFTSRMPFFYDKSDYDYRFLKAYYTNDTVFLKKAWNDIAIADLKKDDGFPDSCRRHPIIGKLEVDEVYQFRYSESFCNLTFYFTISKKANDIKLHSVIYQGDDKDSSCKTVKESTTKLTAQTWYDFERLVEYVDFWGLNQYEAFGCCDGDFLTVKAIVRNRSDHSIVRHHKIDRQFVSNTALFKPYELLVKFANFKSGCKY